MVGRTRRTVAWAIAATLVIAFAATSFTAFGKPLIGQHIAGSYRVVMKYQDLELPHVATFTSDGAVFATFVPLICASGGSSSRTFTTAHGSWDVTIQKGVPVLVFNILSDEWDAPVVLNADGSVSAKGAHGGTVQVVGTAPLTGLPVNGHATLAFLDDQFQGGCSKNPIAVEFSAEPIPARSPSDKLSDDSNQG
jgi:hypothetical protein